MQIYGEYREELQIQVQVSSSIRKGCYGDEQETVAGRRTLEQIQSNKNRGLTGVQTGVESRRGALIRSG